MPERPADALPRRLGPRALTALFVGTIIGSGIFRVSASVAADVHSIAGIAIVWVLGGVISLCGALAIAELAALYPRSGGIYVYLRETYGSGMAFLFGWTNLLLAPASGASLAIVFAEYLGTLLSLSPVMVRVAATSALAISGIAAYRSVRGPSAIVTTSAIAKVGALIVIVVAALLLGDAGAGSFGAGAPVGATTHWPGVGLGLVAALWAYNGFHDVVSVAGEVKEPGRVLPIGLLAGTTIVVAVYLAANAAYLYVLPFDTLRASPLVASDTAVRLLGAIGSRFVAAAVMVSTFGAITGLALATPRLFYAMANEGLLFAPLARVHPRFETPHVAVVFYTVISLAAAWSTTFERLTEAFILGVWPFLALSAAAVIILRRRHPTLERPYRTPGYPFVPLLFIAGTVWIVGSALIARPWTTLAGMGFTLLGVPVYMLRARSSAPLVAHESS